MSDESFAELFAQSHNQRPKMPKPGDRVTGVITSVGSKRLTLDLGNGVDGMMELIELGDQTITPQVGERVEGYVMAIENRVAQIGRSVGKSAGSNAIEQAAAARVPIEGTITGVNKGGYVVEIAGVRCFCPLGQMDLRRIEDPNTQLGKKLTFLVTEMKGRDVVLSRRQLLEAEQAGAREATLQKVIVGAVLEGIVSNVRDFGAFVDLGGIDGLVPVSELAFGRSKAQDAVKAGDKVRVSVLEVKGNPPERITLSMKALMADPFEAALTELEPYLVLKGTVMNVQTFGAFVELAKGVEGLIHVSKFGRRVATPAEVVSTGDSVTVRVEKIEDRKIGLAYLERFEGNETKTQAGLTVLGRDVPAEAPPADPSAPPRRIVAKPEAGRVVEVTVDKIEQFGLFVNFDGGRGLVPVSELGPNAKGTELRKHFPVGSTFRAVILEVRPDGKIRLSKKATEAAEERADAEAFLKTQSGSQSFGTFASKLASALKK